MRTVKTPHPETVAEFGDAWRSLEPAVRRSLSSAPPHVVEDVLQETAIKLLRVWESVDHDRPALPLAVTIARNTLRDELRRSARHAHAELSEEQGVSDDLHAQVTARLELAKVETELPRLTPGQRAALLTEVGGGSRAADSPRVKMLRSRARARLRELVAQAGGFVTTGVARLRSAGGGRMGAAAPDLGALAQALLLAMVATAAGGAVVGDRPSRDPSQRLVAQEAPVVRSVHHRTPTTAASTASGPGAVHRSSRAPAATPVTPPHAPSAGPDSGSGLPKPPIPRAKGRAGDEGHFGTEGYSFASGGENSTAGHDMAWRYESEWESPGCVQKLADGRPPGRCDAPQAPSAEAEAEVDGHRVGAGTGGSDRSKG